jgi:hypothetical protein
MLPEEISDLIKRKSETAHVEFKAGFEWKRENKERQLELLRDMIALANTQDGGKLVLGIEDGTYEVTGLSQEILSSFDQTDVGQMLYSHSEPKVTFELQKIKLNGKDIVVINVSEFTDIPIVCNKSIAGSDPKKLILRQGALYIRTEDAKTVEICSVHEMRQIISRAMLKRGDELLYSIQSLLKGKPIGSNEETINQYEVELKEADQWLIEVLQKGFLSSPRWEVVAHPSQYVPRRITELPLLKQLIKDAQVSLRGWPLPYIGDKSETGMFNSGFQGYSDWQDKREGFRLYMSELFVWKHTIPEDLLDRRTEAGKRTLDFIVTIYRVTEIMLFLKRLYESFPDVEQVHISIRLIGCRERVLTSSEPVLPMNPWNESQEANIEWKDDLTVVQLRADSEQIARRVVRHIFNVFNWTNISEDFLIHWQTNLIPRIKHVRMS